MSTGASSFLLGVGNPRWLTVSSCPLVCPRPPPVPRPRFPIITGKVNAALPTALGTATATTEGDRFYVDTAALRAVVSPYVAPTTVLPTLGTNVTAKGCYVPLWGRLFTVTSTFAVLPPAYFRTYNASSGDSNEQSMWVLGSCVLVAGVWANPRERGPFAPNCGRAGGVVSYCARPHSRSPPPLPFCARVQVPSPDHC